jgi:SSS family solute:Na+ symporter
MIYRVLNPHLDNPDVAYPAVVAAVVPIGFRGLVVAAVISGIMSTVSGLVNSTSTMVTLDFFKDWKGKQWSEARLVSIGRWSGAIALLVGALFAPIVMKWENIFRYAQDVLAPMAAPVVVVFLAGALWKPARERAALFCLWLALLSVPFVLTKAVLADHGVHFLPENLENPMVLAGTCAVISLVFMIGLSSARISAVILLGTFAASGLTLWLATVNPSVIALILLASMVALVVPLLLMRSKPEENLWDRSMLSSGQPAGWYTNLWFWWALLGAILVGIYIKFW